MLAPVTKMQKSGCSTEAINSQAVVTLNDVLYNGGAASIMIQFLNLKAKRSLRLVCHAGKDAVDSTVTYVGMPGLYSKSKGPYKQEGVDYACILSNSNWKGIKHLGYIARQPTFAGKYYHDPEGLAQIAQAGLSKLEKLTLRLSIEDIDEEDRDDALHSIPSKWFGIHVRDANWPLEELIIWYCTDSIVALIAISEWKLKTLLLGFSADTLSPEGVETLMQGSWVSTVEMLWLSYKVDREKKAVRAISQASHRALNLSYLGVFASELYNKDALILAENIYPNLKELRISSFLTHSGIAAILRKCRKLEKFEFDFRHVNGAQVDPEDMKLIAEHCKNGIIALYDERKRYEFEASLRDYL